MKRVDLNRVSDLVSRIRSVGWCLHSSFVPAEVTRTSLGRAFVRQNGWYLSVAYNKVTRANAFLMTDGCESWAVTGSHLNKHNLHPAFDTPEAAIAYWELTQEFSTPIDTSST